MSFHLHTLIRHTEYGTGIIRPLHPKRNALDGPEDPSDYPQTPYCKDSGPQMWIVTFREGEKTIYRPCHEDDMTILESAHDKESFRSLLTHWEQCMIPRWSSWETLCPRCNTLLSQVRSHACSCLSDTCVIPLCEQVRPQLCQELSEMIFSLFFMWDGAAQYSRGQERQHLFQRLLRHVRQCHRVDDITTCSYPNCRLLRVAFTHARACTQYPCERCSLGRKYLQMLIQSPGISREEVYKRVKQGFKDNKTNEAGKEEGMEGALDVDDTCLLE